MDAVALSHGRWDHAGGLEAALALTGRPTPMHVNPGMFASRGIRLASGTVLPMGDVPSPAALERAGGVVVSDAAARTLAEDRFYLSGEIPRRTAYEKGFPPQVKRGPARARGSRIPWSSTSASSRCTSAAAASWCSVPAPTPGS